VSPKKRQPPGITLADVWSYYDGYNKAVSEIARKMAYAGVALIWVFRVTDKVGTHIPRELFVAGFCLASCLLLDFLQQCVGSEVYKRFGDYKQARVSADEKFLQPFWLLWPTDALFWLKVLAGLGGYYFIMHYLWLSFA
jgi:hypothetical protein